MGQNQEIKDNRDTQRKYNTKTHTGSDIQGEGVTEKLKEQISSN